MKKITILIVLVIMCSSCSKLYEKYSFGGIHVTYHTGYCFIDENGQNTVDALPLIEWSPKSVPSEEATSGMISTDEFSLECTLSDPTRLSDFPKGDFAVPNVHIEAFDSKRYFVITLALYTKWSNFQDVISFDLACPQLFGDDETHHIETFWRNHTQQRAGKKVPSYFPECYRIDIDGNSANDFTFDIDRYVPTLCQVELDK